MLCSVQEDRRHAEDMQRQQSGERDEQTRKNIKGCLLREERSLQPKDMKMMGVENMEICTGPANTSNITSMFNECFYYKTY